MHGRRTTFRGKLLLLFLAFSILPLAVVALLVYQTVRDRYQEVLVTSLEQTINLQEMLMVRFFESQITLVRSLAAQDILLAELEKQQAGVAFNEDEVFVSLVSVRRENPFIEKVYILNPQGEVVISTATDETQTALADQSLFIVPFSQRASYVGHVMVSPYGKRVIPIAAPLFRKSDNSVIGVLVIELSSSVANSILASRNLASEQNTDQSQTFVVDRAGYLMTRLPGSGFSDQVLTYPVQICQTEDRNVQGIWEDYQGERVLGVSQCVTFHDLKLILVAEQKTTSAFAVSRQLGLIILAITGAVGLLLTLVTLKVSRSITSPILELRRGTKELGRGNFEYPIKIQTGDELEDLAEDFEDTRHRLRVAKERESYLAKLKSEFISIAAHQLRTPLTGIRWALESIVAAKNLPDKVQTDLKRALKSTNELIQLVNDLLNVSRIEDGRFDYNFVEGNLWDFVRQTVEEVHEGHPEKEIMLHIEEPADVIPHVWFDREKLRMVLANIVDNAIKYTSPGGIVTIRCARFVSGVEITLSDTGIGIPQDQQKNIFTKFFRADNAVRMQTSGSGLGLFVAQQIIKAHGGTISISSVEGKGTTVRLVLPFTPPKETKSP